MARDIDAKLIRRHPHVFGDVDADSSNEVLKIWDEVKLAEKAAKDKAVAAGEAAPEGLLDGVPTHLPALMQAQKVSHKAAAVGFEWETVQDVWDEVAEERAEFEAEAPGTPEREMEFGDLLFALVNVARKEGIDAESALRASTAKFRRRWAAMEQMASDAHVDRSRWRGLGRPGSKAPSPSPFPQAAPGWWRGLDPVFVRTTTARRRITPASGFSPPCPERIGVS